MPYFFERIQDIDLYLCFLSKIQKRVDIGFSMCQSCVDKPSFFGERVADQSGWNPSVIRNITPVREQFLRV